MKKLFSRISILVTGLALSLGMGIAAMHGINSGFKSAKALTIDDISPTAATSVENGAQYVIASGTSGNVYLSAKSGDWGTAVAVGSAYVFTAEGSGTSDFALKCTDGYLAPKTGLSSNSFPNYNNSSKALQLINNEVYSNANSKINLRQNGSSGYKWYGNSTAAGTAGNAAKLYKVTGTAPSISVDKTELTLCNADSSNKTITATAKNCTPTYAWSIKVGSDDVIEFDGGTTSASVQLKAKADVTGNATVVLTPSGVTLDPIEIPVTVEAPKTVSEARYIIDNGTAAQKNNVFVQGIVSEIVTPYSSEHGNISYNISSDGKTTSDQLQSYRGKSFNGEKFTSEDDVKVNDAVIIFGNLTKYSSTYELAQDNYLIKLDRPTAKEVSSIVVKTAPTKVIYKYNETFDATGLVLTVTYTDSSSEDVDFNSHTGLFEFDKGAITESCDVTITYGGKTCTTPVTLNAVTGVTVTSHPASVKSGKTISVNDVTLTVSYSESDPEGGIHPHHINCDTSAAAEDVTAEAWLTESESNVTNKATFTINVLPAPMYQEKTDILDREFTGVPDQTGKSASYSDWSDKSYSESGHSDAVYSGNSAGDKNSIQLRSTNNAGLISTTSGGLVKEVVINWQQDTTNDRTIDVYGKNTAYASVSELYSESTQGEEIGSATFDKGTTVSSTIVAVGDYEYIGIRSHSGALYVTSFEIVWNVEVEPAPKTLTGIEVKTAPTKVAYTEGEAFDPTGLVITATYSDTTTEDVEYAGHESDFTFDPSLTSELSSSDTSVSITYGGKTTTQDITVAAAPVTLDHITVDVSNTKTTFEVGDEFNSTGLVVTAHYSDNSSHTVTPTSVSTPDLSTTGTKIVTVTYTEDTIEKTATYEITVVTPGYSYDRVFTFAKEFLKATRTICADANEETRVAALAGVWADVVDTESTSALHVAYAALNEDDLGVIKVADADFTVDVNNLDDDGIDALEGIKAAGAACARYDWLCQKYGTRLATTYNFLDRNSAKAASFHFFGRTSINNNVLLITLISSITVIAAFGACMMLLKKKRKHN